MIKKIICLLLLFVTACASNAKKESNSSENFNRNTASVDKEAQTSDTVCNKLEVIAANTGVIFTRDTSNSKLGEAYRDPSGLIWGEIMSQSMDYKNADKACKQIGARLPLIREFYDLRGFLGQHSYSTKQAYGPDEILPGLSGNLFWSSSDGRSGSIQVFNGSTGDVAEAYSYKPLSVRCVLRP